MKSTSFAGKLMNGLTQISLRTRPNCVHMIDFQSVVCFQEKIKNLSPETVIFGEKANRVSNTILMALPNIPGDLALMKLDLESFSVSSGSACSSGKISKSHVVSAMGYDKLASNSVRFSFPPNDTILKLESLITTKELDRLARCWSKL